MAANKDEELRLKHHGVASAETVAVAAEQQWHKGLLSREWLALLFAVTSFVLAQIIVRRNARLDHQTEEVKLARDLSSEFYSDQKPYMRIANAIEGCQKLYKSDGGAFNHIQLNEYLGFFSDLGLFIQRGAISPELIGHYFGAFIIEAYEYPEIKAYIERIRKNYRQPEAFEDFERVAKTVEAQPRFARLAEFAKTACADQINQQEGNSTP